jgi:hypothetical protein
MLTGEFKNKVHIYHSAIMNYMLGLYLVILTPFTLIKKKLDV